MKAASSVHVDFHEVKPQHVAIHARLENWAVWSRNRTRRRASSGFRDYQQYARTLGEPLPVPVQVRPGDAMTVEKGVCALPASHREAIRWCYIEPVNPTDKCRKLGTSMTGLAQLLHDARQILVNRGI